MTKELYIQKEEQSFQNEICMLQARPGGIAEEEYKARCTIFNARMTAVRDNPKWVFIDPTRDFDFEIEWPWYKNKDMSIFATEEEIRPFFKALTAASQGTPEEPQYYPKMISYYKEGSGYSNVKFLMKIKGV